MPNRSERILQGIPISQGIAIGRPFFFRLVEEDVPTVLEGKRNPTEEVERYRQALIKCREEIGILQRQLQQEAAYEAEAILEAQLHILQDPFLTKEVEKEIFQKEGDAEEIVRKKLGILEMRFQKIPDPFFQDRFKDIQDVGKRILGHLSLCKQVSLAQVPKASVVFAQELLASDTAAAKLAHVHAFVTQAGSLHSHAAIVAKAKGIPYVGSVNYDVAQLEESDTVIIDGRNGTIVLHPTAKTIEKYRRLQEQLQQQWQRWERRVQEPCQTFDGSSIQLSANIEMLDELDLLHRYGEHDVGLFRSEFLFLLHDSFPTEEEQYGVYRSLVEKMQGRFVVIRTYDFSSDKLPLKQPTSREEIPPLFEQRGMRCLLSHKSLFLEQMRAILRARLHGDVRILFPMVTMVEELRLAKQMIAEAKMSLEEEGYEVPDSMAVGCMVEVPAAAMTVDILAKECDFFSIGTNDLMQYALAIDRGSQAMVEMSRAMLVALMRFVEVIVKKCRQSGKEVGICGDMASDPRYLPLFLGLGITTFSVPLRYIPAVKSAIGNIGIEEARELALEASSMDDGESVYQFLTERYKKKHPEESFFHFST